MPSDRKKSRKKKLAKAKASNGVVGDPIEVLPSELWAQCISEIALCDGGMSNILALTTVSRRWSAAMLSTPILWANIHVNDAEDDCEAKVATFLHLSCDAALSLIIQMPLSKTWSTICAMIFPDRHRIRTLIFDPSAGTSPDRSIIGATADFDGDVQNLFQDLDIQLLETAPYVVMAGNIDVSPSWLPPNLVAARRWRFPLDRLMEVPYSFVNLREISIRCPGLFSLPLHSSKFPVLQYLDIHSEETHQQTTTPLGEFRVSFHLPSLRMLRYHGTFNVESKCLVYDVARTLHNLELEVSILDVPLVLSALKTLAALGQLRLNFQPDYDSSRRGSYGTWSAIKAISTIDIPRWRLPGVHTFTCLLKPIGEQDTPATLDRLWHCFLTMLPNISFITCNVPVRFDTLITTIGQQSNLKSIDCNSKVYPGRSRDICYLPDLKQLRLKDTALLHNLVATSLSDCSLEWLSGSPLLGEVATRRLRTLEVTVNNVTNRPSRPEDPKHNFDISRYSFLNSFSIKFLGREHRLGVTSLSSLKQITISVQSPIFSQGVQFCAALLCDPESCPGLEDLRFNSFMEWDILILMLERRNFLQNTAISKIRRITLLHIAPKPRLIVALLLAGKRTDTTVETLGSLSIGALESSVLDSDRPGCFCCLQMGHSNCSEPLPTVLKPPRNVSQNAPLDLTEHSDQFPYYDWHIPLIRSEERSPQLSPDKIEWFNSHKLRARSWATIASRWYQSHSRLLMCGTQRCSPAVGVTEYDILPLHSVPEDLSQYDAAWEKIPRSLRAPRSLPLDIPDSNPLTREIAKLRESYDAGQELWWRMANLGTRMYVRYARKEL